MKVNAMKKILGTISLVLILVSPSIAFDAHGSAFGNLATAPASGAGQARLVGAVGAADATSFVGSFAYGMSRYIDGRLKLGLVSDNNNTELVFGADLKYQIWSMDDIASHPFDLAVGGLFEFVSFDGSSTTQVGGFGLGSYPIRMRNERLVSPYSRFDLRLESWGSRSELKFGFHGGVRFEASEFISLYGEFQLDGNDGVFLGLDYRIM